MCFLQLYPAFIKFLKAFFIILNVVVLASNSKLITLCRRLKIFVNSPFSEKFVHLDLKSHKHITSNKFSLHLMVEENS